MTTTTTTFGHNGLKVSVPRGVDCTVTPVREFNVLEMVTTEATYTVDGWYEYDTLSGCLYDFYKGGEKVLQWRCDVDDGNKLRPSLHNIRQLIGD